MTWELIALLSYLIYLPLLIFLVLLLIKKYNHFITSKRLLSALAETKSPTFELASFLIATFCLLRLNFAYSLSKLLPVHWSSLVSQLFLFGGTLLGFFIAFYPRDKFKKVHGFFGTSLFIGIIGSLSFLIYPFYLSDHIPNLLIIFNLLIISFAVLMIIADYKSTKKIKDIILEHRSHLQWAVLGMILTWDFLVGLVALVNLLY